MYKGRESGTQPDKRIITLITSLPLITATTVVRNEKARKGLARKTGEPKT